MKALQNTSKLQKQLNPRKKSWDHRKITLRYVSIMALFNTF